MLMRPGAPSTSAPRLSALPPGRWAVVERVDVPPEEARWLAAVGIDVGARVGVLRRAAFGGPLHVRSGSGGSYALGASLAGHILVTPDAVDSAAG